MIWSLLLLNLSPDQNPFYVSRIESRWCLLRTCSSSITMTEIDWLLKSKQMLQQMWYWYWFDHPPDTLQSDSDHKASKCDPEEIVGKSLNRKWGCTSKLSRSEVSLFSLPMGPKNDLLNSTNEQKNCDDDDDKRKLGSSRARRDFVEEPEKHRTLIRICLQAKYVQLPANQKMRKYDLQLSRNMHQQSAVLCFSRRVWFLQFFCRKLCRNCVTLPNWGGGGTVVVGAAWFRLTFESFWEVQFHRSSSSKSWVQFHMCTL